MFGRGLVRLVSKRALSRSLPRQNLIQELYLKELKVAATSDLLKNIKAEDISTANVVEWKIPSKPTVPALELDKSEILNDYINSNVETTSNATPAVETQQADEEDWLVLDDIEEEPAH